MEKWGYYYSQDKRMTLRAKTVPGICFLNHSLSANESYPHEYYVLYQPILPI